MVNFKAIDNKLLKICLCVCATVGINACDTGDYNDLKCDPSYVSECLSENAFMACNGSILQVQYCQNGNICRQTETGATCVPPSTGTKCTANSCMSDTILNQCGADGNYTQVDCSANGQICQNNACVTPQQPPTCSPSCNSDGLFVGCNEDGTAKDPVDCSTVGEGFQCINNECAKPADQCLPYCNNEGLQVVCNEDGSWADPKPCDEGFVCDGGECKSATECKPACTEDGLILLCNEDGTLAEEGVSCASEEHPDFVCIDGECKAPECVAECNAEGLLILCDEAGNKLDPISCAEFDPEHPDYVCVEGACKEEFIPCTEDICADDGLTRKVCNLETGEYTDESCAEANQICNRGACITPDYVVGLPCTCEGEDCDIIYTGAELKSVFSDDGKVIFGEYLANINDDDIVSIPNFFSENIKGCDALRAQLPEGLAVGCFRDSAVQIPENIISIVKNDFANILINYMAEGANLADAFLDFGNKLESVKFSGRGGYCMPAALQVSGEDLHKLNGADVFIEDAFAADGLLASKLNVGSVADAKLAAASIEPDSETTYCPAGSSFFSYELNKKAKYLGKLHVHFAMCLQNCEEETDCRDGFSCIDFTEFTSRTSADPASKVCFNQESIDEMLNLKASLRNVIANMKGSGSTSHDTETQIACDPENFVNLCVRDNAYVSCKAETGLLIATFCKSGDVCVDAETGASCMPADQAPEPDPKFSCDETSISRCISGANAYAYCDVSVSKYSLKRCEEGTVCVDGEEGASCEAEGITEEPIEEPIEEPTEEPTEEPIEEPIPDGE